MVLLIVKGGDADLPFHKSVTTLLLCCTTTAMSKWPAALELGGAHPQCYGHSRTTHGIEFRQTHLQWDPALCSFPASSASHSSWGVAPESPPSINHLPVTSQLRLQFQEIGPRRVSETEKSIASQKGCGMVDDGRAMGNLFWNRKFFHQHFWVSPEGCQALTRPVLITEPYSSQSHVCCSPFWQPTLENKETSSGKQPGEHQREVQLDVYVPTESNYSSFFALE